MIVKSTPEDFRVEEIPAYEPSGQGDHVHATIEKTGLTTFEAVQRLARALAVRPDDVGTAGMKDKQAVTVQRISLPPPVTPEQVLAVAIDGVRVLAAARHPHKLRTGHLRGNRFMLRARELGYETAEAERRARAALVELSRPPGVPAFYGEQRFGARGDNAARGRAILRGEETRVPPRERRLLVSALQSQLFNTWLEERLKDGLYHRVIAGDVLQKTDSGGLFVTPDPAVDQARLEAGAVAPTGPMFGHSMRAPPEGSEAAEREARILAAAGLTPADFARAGKLAEGTRRPAGFALGAASATALPDGALELVFTLPPGGYATVVVKELSRAGNL